MNVLKRLYARVRARPFLYGGLVLLVILALWFIFGRSGTKAETLTVTPGNFKEELSLSGTVIAAQNAELGFAQSGRVMGVYARVGDHVGEGATLAAIENGELRAAVANEEAKLVSLLAGTRPEEIAVAQAQVESDQSALAQANQAVIDAIKNAYTVSDDAVYNKTDQIFQNPRTTPKLVFGTSNSQLEIIVVSDRASVEAMLNVWQSSTAGLSTGDNTATAAAEAQRNLSQVSKLLYDANAALNAAIPTTAIPQATINTYITNVATARANVNTAVSTLTSALTSQKNAAATLTKDQRTLDLKKAGATAADLEAQRANVTAARAQLQKTLVIAPFAGTVTKMDIKVGEIVSPNTSEISLMSAGRFQIESYVPEVNIAQVAVGNPATATLDAFGASVRFDAKVISIDPARTLQNGVSTYKTMLQFAKDDERIRSGMTASVTITTGEHENAIIIPQGALIRRGTETLVQIQQGKNVQEIPVTVGPVSSLGEVEVKSGLRTGDVVILNPSE